MFRKFQGRSKYKMYATASRSHEQRPRAGFDRGPATCSYSWQRTPMNERRDDAARGHKRGYDRACHIKHLRLRLRSRLLHNLKSSADTYQRNRDIMSTRTRVEELSVHCECESHGYRKRVTLGLPGHTAAQPQDVHCNNAPNVLGSDASSHKRITR